MRRLVLVLLSAVVPLLGFLASTGPAGAVTAPKATGSVELGSPIQYASFDAFATDPVKGSISYTNFEFPVVGTGVWVPTDFTQVFTVTGDGTGTYTQTVDSWTPISPTSVTFAGHGTCGCGWHSTFTGAISGSAFSMSMTEINDANNAETYALTATGTIAPDGSVSGTWSDNYGGVRTGTFTIASVGHEVFHYVAPMATVSVTGNTADFSFQIPAGVPYTGTWVYVHVTDGGSPGAGNDTWSHNGGSYPILAGNLTVFS